MWALSPGARLREGPDERERQPAPSPVTDRAPGGEAGRDLAEIVDSQAIRAMMEDISRLTGIATALLDTRGTVIAATGWQEICTRFHRADPQCAAACTESDLFLAKDLRPGEFAAYRCRNGLWDVVTPLWVGDRHLGNIYTGQFLYDDEPVDEASFRARAAMYGFNPEEYLAALRKVPRVSRQKIRDLMNYLVRFAALFSRLSSSNVALERALAVQRSAEAGIRASEERYHALFESSGSPLVIINRDTTIAQVNREFEKVSGWPRAAIEGKMRLAAFIRGSEDLGRVLSNHRLRRLDPGADPTSFEVRFSGRTGSPADMILSVSLIPGTDQSLIAFLDITARKKAENALLGLSGELEERVRERTLELSAVQDAYRAANAKLNLLSGITRHDISNQLTMLQGYLAMLEKKQTDPVDREHFRKVRDAAGRISAMISFTKEYESIGVTAPVWQDCRALANAAAAAVQTGSVRVVNDLPAGSEIFADSLIAKVFYNLIDNAIRYGETITEIRFSAEEREGAMVILCTDNGRGIDAADKARIFGKGFGKNTGLGLFLAREILDITGIRIAETGEPGKGARFELLVPDRMFRIRQP